MFQDFESNPALKNMAIDFLEDIICSGAPALLPSEHRASSQLLRMLTKEESDRARERVDLHSVLNMGQVSRSSILITEWPSRIIPIDGVSLRYYFVPSWHDVIVPFAMAGCRTGNGK